MENDYHHQRLSKMTSAFCVTVSAFIAFTALGFAANSTNRSEPLRNFEMFNADGKFVIGKRQGEYIGVWDFNF